MKPTFLQTLMLIALLLTGINVFAYDFSAINDDGVTIYYTITDETTKFVEVTQGPNDYIGHVNIPNTVSYDTSVYTVTSIGNSAFWDCSGLTSVTIPNYIKSIGVAAFYGCVGLTSVNIPNSVTSIESSAFPYCEGLTSISVDENNLVYDSRNNCNAIIESASNSLISGCKNTIIPESVTSIEFGAFVGCNGLTEVIIPNSVTNIGDVAFLRCNGLTKVTIPNSVTSIGDSAFYGCGGLTSVNIPNSVTSIESGAFGECSGLISISVDENNSIYDSRDNCNAIIESASNTLISGCKNTIIPESVTNIGSYAFANCEGLTEVTYLAKEPITADTSIFSNYDYATLYVPEESISIYKTTQPWCNFNNIIGVSSGVEETFVNDNTPAEYYNMQGIKIENPSNGIFIRKQGDKTTKVVL